MNTTGKRKILVPIFNRAHYGRLRSVLNAIKNHPQLELKIIVAVPAAYGGFFNNLAHSRPRSWRSALPWYVLARARSLVSQRLVVKNDFLARSLAGEGFKIEVCVPLFFDGGNSTTMAKSVGQGLIKLVDVMKKIKPDAVFVNADRFEMMAIAIAAAYLNIPVAHNEGGDVSGTIDESVRHSITKLAHIHFTSTESSKKRVEQMGEDPSKVFAVGSPAIDAVALVDFSKTPSVFSGLDISKPYLLVLAHPVATRSAQDNIRASQNLVSVLKELALPAVVLGSNIDAGSDVLGKVIKDWMEGEKPQNIFFAKNLKPDEFYWYLKNAACAVGNSSSFIREGAYLGTPVVLLGSRQNNRERSDNVLETAGDAIVLKEAILNQMKGGRFAPSYMFGDGQASAKIADKLATVDLEIQKTFKDI